MSPDKPKQTSFPPDVQATTDAVRLKCRTMLASALKTERNYQFFPYHGKQRVSHHLTSHVDSMPCR